MVKPKPVTCRECGRRRVKALVTHPITGNQRRTPVKLCQECHSKTIDYPFFNSSFGQWLRRAFQRQCTNSIPKDTHELRGVMYLWKFYRKACGFHSDGEEVLKTYDYQLCHIDPVKGDDGSIGRLVSSNLIIAPTKLNRELSNIPYPYTSKESVTLGDPINDDNFTSICRERYDIPLLISEFCLIPVKRGKELPVFKSSGVDVPTTLSKELKRLGYPISHIIPMVVGAEERAIDIYDTFFKVGGTLACNLLIKDGMHCPSSRIEYDFTTPYERNKLNKIKRETRKNEEEEWW